MAARRGDRSSRWRRDKRGHV